MEAPLETIRHREIQFAPTHPDPRPAHSATLLLSDVTGIVRLAPVHELRLQVSYDLNHISLRVIDDTLWELGFHLDNTLLNRIKRTLYYYSEEIQQDNLACARGYSNCTQKAFVTQYQRRPHGCRDERPVHWRKYL